MPKSLLGLHRAMQKQEPHFKLMKKLANWYEEHPFTLGVKSEKIKIIHENFERAQRILDVKHAAEVSVLRQKNLELQAEAKALGAKHLGEKKDLTMGYCTVEWDLLQDKITELPEEFKPVHKDPNWLGRLFAKLSTT